MTYDSIVSLFKTLSGRTDFDDETCLIYLNAGQKFLDDATDYQTSPSRYVYTGSIGDYFLSLTAQAKIIKSIELISDGSNNKVVEIPLADLQSLSDTLPSFKDSGLPTVFAVANIRKVNGDALAVADQNKLAVIETGTIADKLGILFECPFDKAYTIDITGKFYSTSIAEGTDPDTFWAINYPLTLIHSALYKLEIGYRNTEGANDWLKAVMADLKLIDNNVAEQESTNASQMGG